MALGIRTNAVIVDTSQSPHARLRPVAVGDVRLSDPIWEPRRRITIEKTIPEMHALLESSERLDNFRRGAGKLDGPFHGLYFNDTDVYKWLEAASWALAMDEDPELDRLVDEVIGIVGDAQQPDAAARPRSRRRRVRRRPRLRARLGGLGRRLGVATTVHCSLVRRGWPPFLAGAIPRIAGSGLQ